MRLKRLLSSLAVIGTLIPLAAIPTLPARAEGNAGRVHYLMGCVGCHGEAGVTTSTRVPDIKDQIGYFLNLPEGRAYLVRLPNVAFDPISDQQVADMLNYMVFEMGGGSAPKGAKRYSAAEVGPLRKQPLTEVPLFQYRADIVEKLIADYKAPETMRVYGTGLYGN